MPLESELESGKPWQFDAAVAARFDEMLERSIPHYHQMRQIVFDIGCRFVHPSATVLDLGCSRGEALSPFVNRYKESLCYTGLEVSEPMRTAAEERFFNDLSVEILDHDLREHFHVDRTCLALSVLTLMFVPIEHRQRVVDNVYASLENGGAFILVEKVIGGDATTAGLLTNAYHDMKMANGYSREDVDRKALALEGVLVPVTAAWNEDMLRTGGFRHVECIWRTLNFAAWVAIK